MGPRCAISRRSREHDRYAPAQLQLQKRAYGQCADRCNQPSLILSVKKSPDSEPARRRRCHLAPDRLTLCHAGVFAEAKQMRRGPPQVRVGPPGRRAQPHFFPVLTLTCVELGKPAGPVEPCPSFTPSAPWGLPMPVLRQMLSTSE